MSKPRLVTGLQISFLCFDPDQVDLLKVLRGGSRKIWEFHLPYWVGPSRLTCNLFLVHYCVFWISELDITGLNMILCRDTLNVRSEMEVFTAVQRWSYRECRRQRLPITGRSRRKVLAGSQYLVRYLTLSR